MKEGRFSKIATIRPYVVLALFPQLPND
jgi:hypothetical protein